MGCGVYRTMSIEGNTIVQCKLSNQYLSLLLSNLTSYSQISSYSLRRCLKFKIPKPENKLLRVQMDSLFDPSIFGATNYPTQMNSFISDYNIYQSIESLFYTSIHSVCIPEFSLEIGMVIVLISLMNRINSVEIQNNCPFITSNSIKERNDENDIYFS